MEAETGGENGAWSPAGAIRAIDEARIGVIRAWDAWSGITVREDGGLVWALSDVPSPLFNSVVRTRLTADSADAGIERIKGEAASRGDGGVPVSWLISPLTEPPDMSSRLLASGFTPGATTVGMASRLDGLPPEVTVPSGLRILEVGDTESLRAWSETVVAVYGFQPFVSMPWFELHSAMGVGEDKPWRHYLARLDGEAVGAASVYIFEGSAFVANVATVPWARGVGIGTAMTLKALWHARGRGSVLATLCATRMALGMYRRLGFREKGRLWFYTWPPETKRRVEPPWRDGTEYIY